VPGLTPDALEAAVRKRLGQQGDFEVPEADRPVDRTSDRRTFRGFVEVLFSRMRTGTAVLDPGVARVDVVMELERVAGGPGLEAYAARSSEDRALRIPKDRTTEDFWVGVAVDGVADAFRSIQVQFRARDRSLAELLADLKAADLTVRVSAVRQIGERRDTKALHALVELLNEPHQDVVLAAVGALGSLKDARAVPALIQSTRGRSNVYMASVVGALQTLGGVEAEAFLETISVGHGDADLRARAAKALSVIRARRSGGR